MTPCFCRQLRALYGRSPLVRRLKLRRDLGAAIYLSVAADYNGST